MLPAPNETAKYPLIGKDCPTKWLQVWLTEPGPDSPDETHGPNDAEKLTWGMLSTTNGTPEIVTVYRIVTGEPGGSESDATNN